MKKFLIISVLLAASLFNAELWADEPKETAVGAVIAEIQKGIAEATRKLDVDGSDYDLKKVELILNTVAKKEAGPKFKFLIFSIGKTWSKSQTQQLKFTLTPKKSPVTPTGAKDFKVSEILAGAIVDSINGVKQSAIHEDVPLELDQLEVLLKFVVSEVGKVGVEFKISILSTEIGGSVSEEETQQMKVIFGKKK